MTDYHAMLTGLFAPFPPSQVSWRIGATTQDKTKGIALAYIDARDVMDRLDAVCGPHGWQCDYPHANGKTVCRIGIKVGDEWIWKADGAGDSDVEAEKGALSDAFKRAAVRWGIGRYLYDLGETWVAIEPKGRSSVIVKSEYAKLEARLSRSGGQSNRTPGGETLTGRETGAVKQGPAPVSSNREDPADTYVKTAIAAMNTARTADDLKAWWAEQANAREDFGIAKGGKRYALLWDAFLAKGTALKSQPDPDAYASELEAVD